MDCDCESITFEQNYYREVIDTVARYMIINILEENDEDFEQIPEPFSVENVIAIVVLEQLKKIEKPFKTIKKFYDEPELIEEFIDYEKVSRIVRSCKFGLSGGGCKSTGQVLPAGLVLVTL